MKQNKPHIKELGCYKQVADVIGEVNAQKELWKVVHCEDVVGSLRCNSDLLGVCRWDATPQGLDFWSNVEEGVNPYE